MFSTSEFYTWNKDNIHEGSLGVHVKEAVESTRCRGKNESRVQCSAVMT